MSRIAHGALAALAVLTALAIPANSHAQFGGLIKKKIAQTAINKALPQPAAPADTQAARRAADEADRKARQDAWAHPTPITATNLGNFVTAIRAEQAERAKAAAAPGSPLGKSTQYATAKATCTRELAKNDSSMKKMQADMQALASAGKVDALQAYYAKVQKINNEHIALANRCNSLVKPELTDADFALIRARGCARGFGGRRCGRLHVARIRPPARARDRVHAHARELDAVRLRARGDPGDRCTSAGAQEARRQRFRELRTAGVARLAIAFLIHTFVPDASSARAGSHPSRNHKPARA